MPRLKALTNTEATGKACGLLGGVEKKLGTVPNVMRTMANSPAVLEAYLAFTSALAKGSLSTKLREQIALAVGAANDCEYCVAAHSTLGQRAGLTEAEILESRQGISGNPKTSAALTFAHAIVHERGRVSNDDVEALRAAAYNDGEITEIVANVAANLFTNYLNHVAQTEVDFPKVGEPQSTLACAC